MKKNTRIIGAAAAALLAVAPVATSVVPNGSNVVQAAVKVTNPNAIPKDTGTPYFVQVVDGKMTVVTHGSIDLQDNNVQSIVKQIKDKYKAYISDNNNEITLTDQDIQTAVYQGLNDAHIFWENNNSGDFPQPAMAFKVELTAKNAKKDVKLLIDVNPLNVSTDYRQNPQITYGTKEYDHNQNIDVTADFATVPVNGIINVAAIQDAFKAVASKASNSQSLTPVVDISRVNTSVPGTYPVTVSATNAAGKTTTLTFNLTVGVKGAKYMIANNVNGQLVQVYSINGNAVNQTTTTIANGTSVPTFNTITVGGVSYTRINGEKVNQFVLTDQLKSNTPAETSQAETVMVTSNAYDKNGKYLGHKYYAYDTINIVPTVVTINGKTYYKIAGKDEYVRVINITGQTRTLKHNAYVYATSTRRNRNYKLMHKGDKVTTYGGTMKFRNGKRYYRIEGCRDNDKKYIKAVNFY